MCNLMIIMVPDMTNFGHKLKMMNLMNCIKEEMSKFKQHILNDDHLQKYGDLGNVYGKTMEIG